MGNQETQYTKIGIPEPEREWTAQEVFDLTVAHLYTQGAPSVEENASGTSTQCLYRSAVGACAFGYWIPDDLYSPAMENLGARGLIGALRADSSEEAIHAAARESRLGPGAAFGALLRCRDLRSPAVANMRRHMGLLVELQNTHDAWAIDCPTRFDSLAFRLYETANDFALDPSLLDALFPDFGEPEPYEE